MKTLQYLHEALSVPKATSNEAGNCFVRKVAGLPLERIFRRWSHALFLINQSYLLFSWKSAQVSRDETCMGGSEAPLQGGGICHIYLRHVKACFEA